MRASSPLSSTSALILLGEASYALYILHYPLLAWLTHVLHPGRFASSPVFFALYLSIALAMAVVSFRFVEQPARRAIRRAYARRSEAHLPTPAVAVERVS